MSTATLEPSQGLVLMRESTGHTVIPKPNRLTRLHYFDGKFLRAQDLHLEQRYLRQLSALGNQLGGQGPVHGFDCSLEGEVLRVGPGLAVDGRGQILDLGQELRVSVHDLLRASRPQDEASGAPSAKDRAGFERCEPTRAEEPGSVLMGACFYLLTVGHAEALCGEEEVYGQLCEAACSGDTERPFLLEGVVLRLIPWRLTSPLPDTPAIALGLEHLRSRLASAYFAAEERGHRASRISGEGLASELWCRGAAALEGGEVALALIAQAGDRTLFLDPWVPRRERMETPPRHSWAWPFAMRPWPAFLAQVLQFQCQLRDSYMAVPPGVADPCAGLVGEAAEAMKPVLSYLSRVSQRLAGGEGSVTEGLGVGKAVEIAGEKPLPFLSQGDGEPRLGELEDLQRRLVQHAATGAGAATGANELIHRGFVELPSAGYLPVIPGTELNVQSQVRRLMGEGVDLRFCAVRADFVPHALEEAQHMQRISLIAGLEDDGRRPEVDVLVPDAELEVGESNSVLAGFEVTLAIGDSLLRGVARAQGLPGGGGALHFGGASGTAGASVLKGDLRKVLRTKSPERAAAHDGEAAVNGSAAEARFAVSDPSLSRMHVLADEARLFNRRHRRLRTMAALKRDEEPAPVQVFVPAQPEDEEPVALWATMESARNPFQMRAGESTSLRLQGRTGTPEERSFGTDLDLHGTLTLERVEPRVDGVSAQGRLIGSAQHRDYRQTGTNTNTDSNAIDHRVEMLWRRSGDRQELELRLTELADPSAGAVLGPAQTGPDTTVIKVSWKGATQSAQGTVQNVDPNGNRSEPVASAKLRHSSSALAPGSEPRSIAEGALELVGALRREPAFAAHAGRLLFGELDRTANTRQLRATRDWVFFHRRRRKECSDEQPRPQLGERTYRLMHLQVATSDAAVLAAEQLRGGNADGLSLEPVSTLRFQEASDSLLSNPVNLQQDWMQALGGPGATLFFRAVVADPEGRDLALARLARTEQELLAQSPLASGASFDYLPTVPAGLDTSGADALLVLVTVRKPVVTQCQTVRSIDREGLVRVRQDLESGNLAAVVNAGQALGNVVFDSDLQPQGSSLDKLVAAWTEQGFGAPISGLALHAAGNNGEFARAQAITVLERLGGGNVDLSGLEPWPPIGVACDSLLFVVAPPVARHRMRLLMWADKDGDGLLDPAVDHVESTEEILLVFRPDGSLQTPLSDSQLATIVDRGTFPRIDLVTDTTNARAERRRQRLVQFLIQSGVPAPDASAVRSGSVAERSLLTLANGEIVDELLLLQLG